ncbi:MAG: hypothetical protein JW795_17915, partial [Chitinivibrionales bacterium]|nr:hypothetical protein [Chitinivibrionales bacterium]
MKNRTWIVVCTLFIVCLGCTFFYIKRSIEKNGTLERIINQHISPLIGGAIQVNKIRIGFFSLYFSDVKVSIPLRSFLVTIDDIQVTFSPLRLLQTQADLASSITTVILVNPTIDVSLAQQAGSVSSAEAFYRQSSFWPPRPLPQGRLMVRNCTVRIRDQSGYSTIIGEQLGGFLIDSASTVSLQMHGKLASDTRNLSVAAFFNRTTKKNRITATIDSATIQKPIRYKNISLVDGCINGTVDFSISDSTADQGHKNQGILAISRGVCVIGGCDTIKDISLRTHLTGATIRVDSINGYLDSSRIQGSIQSGVSQKHYQCIEVQISNCGRSLLRNVPHQMRNAITKKGTIVLKAVKDSSTGIFSEGPTAVTMTASGFEINNSAVRSCRMVGTYTHAQSLTIDTGIVLYNGIAGLVHGSVNLKKPMTISQAHGSLTGTIDSLASGVAGRFVITGQASGSLADPTVKLAASSDSVWYKKVKLRNVKGTAYIQHGTVVVSVKPQYAAPILVTGSINKLFTAQPMIDVSVQGIHHSMSTLAPVWLQNIIGTRGDSLSVAVHIKGILPRPLITALFTLKSTWCTATGTMHGTYDDTLKVWWWSCAVPKLQIKDSSFTLAASGMVHNDTVTATSIAIDQSVSATAVISMDSAQYCQAEVKALATPVAKFSLLFGDITSVVRKGAVSGTAMLDGPLSNLTIRANLQVHDATIGSAAGFETSQLHLIMENGTKTKTFMPFTIYKRKKAVCLFDTVRIAPGRVVCSGSFRDISVADFLKNSLTDDDTLSAFVSGTFSTTRAALPMEVRVHCPQLRYNQWRCNSVNGKVRLFASHCSIDTINAITDQQTTVAVSADFPWSYLKKVKSDNDTLSLSLAVKGDLLANLHNFLPSFIQGSLKGELSAVVGISGDRWNFSHALVDVGNGFVNARPFVPSTITDVAVSASLDDSSRLLFSFRGMVEKRPLIITNTHSIADGFAPVEIGSVDLGIIQISTPKKGITIHIPGFMEPGTKIDVEFAAKAPLRSFSLSGPIEQVRVSGIWILRNSEFTYPLLETHLGISDGSESPLNYVLWDLDLKPGDRKLLYFYTIGSKKAKLLRFTECYLDPSSYLRIRGCRVKNTFRLYGNLRSYRGYAFYGRTFDRNFEAGLDFIPQKVNDSLEYDNLPIIWGSAETFSDSSRFDRIKLTLLTKNPASGALQERGRFKDISFRVSSDFEEIPGEAERRFYQDAGLEFTSLKGAGTVFSSISDQYINKYFLQRIQRSLAKSIGIDVINFETSITSNYFKYFYKNQQLQALYGLSNQWNYLTFANVGITVGHYFLQDKVFLKWRTEIIPLDSIALKPEHN